MMAGHKPDYHALPEQNAVYALYAGFIYPKILTTAMQRRLISYTKEVNNYTKIVELLAGGATKAQVARALKLSAPYVHKVAHKAVKQGILARAGKYPVLYMWAADPPKKDINQISGWGGEPAPLYRLHRIGYSYLLHQKIQPMGAKEHKMRNWSMFVRREGGLTVVFYPNKIHIWVALTTNKRIKQQLDHAKGMVRARAEALAQQYRVKISFDKSLATPEAEVIDKELVNYLRKDMNITHQPIDLKDAMMLQDTSHENPEIIGKAAMDRAETLRFLLDEGADSLLTIVERQNILLKELKEIRTAVEYLMEKQ